jgi:sugar lactone lactonase YvrE
MTTTMVPVASLLPVGTGLSRPECVVAVASGALYVPHWPGGVTRIGPDLTQQTWTARDGAMDLRPNGIEVEANGCFLMASLGADGGVWRLGRDGTVAPVLREVDGIALPSTNFVTVDRQGRMWISVSTRHTPRQDAWRSHVRDGFVVVVDARGPRIVADGLHYTNEVRPDPEGRWLYVVETFGRRLSRFPIQPNGDLGTPETVITLPDGCFPDGFAFDEEGGLWVTSLVSNRLLRLKGDTLTTVIEDCNASFVARVEKAFVEGAMAAEHLGPIPGTRLQQLTSIAFGGPRRRTVYLGSLHAPSLYRFEAAVTGAALPSWRTDPAS